MKLQKVNLETIQFIIEEYKCMKNQFLLITDNDIIIHCYKYLQEKNSKK